MAKMFDATKVSWAHHLEETFDPATGRMEIYLSWRDKEGIHYGIHLKIDPRHLPVCTMVQNAEFVLYDINKADTERKLS